MRIGLRVTCLFLQDHRGDFQGPGISHANWGASRRPWAARGQNLSIFQSSPRPLYATLGVTSAELGTWAGGRPMFASAGAGAGIGGENRRDSGFPSRASGRGWRAIV